MLTTEELSGIVEVMVVVSEDEIIDIAQELAYLRDDETPDLEDLSQLITLAMKIHWLEPIPSTAVFSILVFLCIPLHTLRSMLKRFQPC